MDIGVINTTPHGLMVRGTLLTTLLSMCCVRVCVHEFNRMRECDSVCVCVCVCVCVIQAVIQPPDISQWELTLLREILDPERFIHPQTCKS